MKHNFLSALLILFLSSTVMGQVTNSGGGGPDGEIDPEILFKHKLLDRWFKAAQDQWQQCYKSQLPAKNLVSLYSVLSLKESVDGENNNCYETASSCFFSNPAMNIQLMSVMLDSRFMGIYMEPYRLSDEVRKKIKDFYFKNLHMNDQSKE